MAQEAKTIASSLEARPTDDVPDRRQRYNRAVREARLVTILLSSLKFDVVRKSGRPKDEVLKSSYAGQVVDASLDRDLGALAVTVRWTVNIKAGRKKYSSCTAEYDIIYDKFSDIDEEIAFVFAENVAQPATYAYFRALYASLDWSAGLKNPPLPVIKFHPKI
jgi:hypothetical protein